MKRLMMAAALIAGLGMLALPATAGSDTSGKCDANDSNTVGTGIGKGTDNVTVGTGIGKGTDATIDGTGIGKGDANTSLPGSNVPDNNTGKDSGKHCD